MSSNPIILEIWNKRGEFLGKLSLFENGEKIDSSQLTDHSLIAVIKGCLLKGVTVHLEPLGGKIKEKNLIPTVIKKNDQRFFAALKNKLKNKGYLIRQKYPELVKQVREEIKSFPEGEDKKELTANLSSMSYLQLTYILERISQFKKTA